MRLYDYFRSSASFRLRIALNLKGLTPDRTFLHLRRDGGEHKRPEYRQINPQAMVPTLTVGKDVLTQSLAIIEYLEETHPAPALLPADPVGRAHARAIAQLLAADVHPLNNLRVLEHLRANFGPTDAALQDWCRHWVDEGFLALEALLRRLPIEPYSLGATPGLADICIVAQVVNAHRYDLDMGPYPHIARIYDGCMVLPAFASAHPALQPDAE